MNITFESENYTVVSKENAVDDCQFLEGEEAEEEELQSESSKRLAIINKNWDNLPFWLKLKIFVLCELFYCRHLFLCFLGLKHE